MTVVTRVSSAKFEMCLLCYFTFQKSDKLPTSQEEGIGDNVTREASKAVEKVIQQQLIALCIAKH